MFGVSEWLALEQAVIVFLLFIGGIVTWCFRQAFLIRQSILATEENKTRIEENKAMIQAAETDSRAEIQALRHELKTDHQALSDKLSERTRDIHDRIEKIGDRFDDRISEVKASTARMEGMMQRHWEDR